MVPARARAKKETSETELNRSLLATLCLLVYPHVIHFKLGGELRFRRIAPLRSSDGQVEQQVVWLVKRLASFVVGIDRVRERRFVEQLPVDRNLNRLGVPIELPNVKLAWPALSKVYE